MMMVMVKADDDHDNDEGGFGMSGENFPGVSIEDLPRAHSDSAPIPYLVFPPNHQDHVFIKSKFCFTLPKLVLIFTLVSFYPTNHIMPGNCIMVSEMFRL